jgi:hypothetical protein
MLLWGVIISCNGGGSGFAGAEETSTDTTSATDIISPIVIDGHSPSDNPVIMTDSSNVTFALSLSSGNYRASYNFKLDGISVQESASPFYNLAGNLLATGDHTLKVIVTNPISTDFYQFNIRKNASPSIDSFTPSDSNQSVTCGSGSLDFSATASDPEGDSLTFTWLVNGVAGSPSFSTTTGATDSSTTFSPTCSVTGNVTVSVQVSDGHDTDVQSWTVNVINPNIASIDTYSPSTNPTVILSTQSKTFSVGASGTAPLSYKWYLDDVEISGATGAMYEVTQGSLTPTNHSLKVIVTDGGGTTDEHTFTVIQNVPPVIDVSSPTLTTLKLNYQSTKTFGVSMSDANGDALSYTWILDGNSNSQLTHTDSGNSSSALLTPLVSMLGTHTVEVTISDGYESTSTSWQVTINRFSDTCNNLTAGQVCTLVGKIGLNNNSDSPNGKPGYVLEDPNHSGNFFISDYDHHVIWYFNNTVADITRMGIDIPAYHYRVIIGNGASGRSSDGLKNIKFKLYEPRGMAYDTNSDSLFVADRANNRVVQILSDGTGRRVIGQANGAATNSSTHNVAGTLARDHYMYGPYAVEIDNTNHIAYVANYYGHNIKKFDISDSDYNNWTGEVLVGRNNGSDAITSGSDNDGTTDFTTSAARTVYPDSLKLNSDGTLLFFTEWNQHKLKVVNLTSSAKTFFDGELTVDAGHVKKLVGNGSGPNEAGYATLKIRNPRGVELYESGGVLKGFFVTNYYSHRVTFINNTGSDITMGNELVPAKTGHYVLGNGTWGFNGTTYAGNVTYLHYPHGIYRSGSNIYVTNTGNGRVLTLKIDEDDGAVGNPISFTLLYDLIDSINPNGLSTNQINRMAFNAATNEIYFADYYNGRIRKINAVTGDASIVLGYGRSNIDHEQDLPQDVYVYDLAGMTFYNGYLLYADQRTNSWTTNRHCLVRAYNSSASDIDFWGTTVNAGRVATIAGSTALGCHYQWDSSYEGKPATEVRLMVPEDIMVYNNELFITNERGYCILKVAADGTTSTFLGQCGAGGNTNGAIGSSDVKLYDPTEMVLDPQGSDGSFFFLDRSMSSDSRLKYVNRSSEDVTIAGSVIPAGFVGTVVQTIGGYSRGLAVKDNWICYTSGYKWHGNSGAHNVQCFDRTGATPTSSTFQVGPNNGDYLIAGANLESEYEGVTASQTRLFSPVDLEFDGEGNLYISEFRGNTIRFVKRWW